LSLASHACREASPRQAAQGIRIVENARIGAGRCEHWPGRQRWLLHFPRAVVLVAATTGLRWGELVGLRRRHIDLVEGFLNVAASVVEVGGSVELGRTKSAAGVRTVGLPAVIVPELREHLQRWAEAGPDGRVFVGPKGATPRRSNFNRAWSAALDQAEKDGTPLPDGLHFHDLRHTANGFASNVASLKELMARMGHSTTRAALIYQHARRDCEREIAAAVSAAAEAELARKRSHR
jgi:integrase